MGASAWTISPLSFLAMFVCAAIISDAYTLTDHDLNDPNYLDEGAEMIVYVLKASGAPKR